MFSTGHIHNDFMETSALGHTHVRSFHKAIGGNDESRKDMLY